jgi:hypothetical protein
MRRSAFRSAERTNEPADAQLSPFQGLKRDRSTVDNENVAQTKFAGPLEHIEARIAPLRVRLAAHAVYSCIRRRPQLRASMESHVFAVRDFMSLLKTLQAQISCVALPWIPTRWPQSRRFINEIVLGEESDLYQGRSVSHFRLYPEAMLECGANIGPIEILLKQIAATPSDLSMQLASAPPAARRFVEQTFELIRTGNPNAIAAAFTFGREDLIMFRKLAREFDDEDSGRFSKFMWYLERHIEVDEQDHGPLALRMVADLCGRGAEAAILARIALWDGILVEVEKLTNSP